MRTRIACLLLMFAGTASAQDTGQWVSGRDAPESVPDWLVLDVILRTALQAESQSARRGEKFLVSASGVSASGAEALLAYARTTKQRAAAVKRPGLKADLCPRRKQLLVGDSLAAAIDSYMAVELEYNKQSIDGVYVVLTSNDAAKLRKHVAAARGDLNVFQTDVKQLAAGIGDPKLFLDRLCGGAS